MRTDADSGGHTGGLASRTWGDARFHGRLSLAFQLLVQVAAFALFGPLLTWAVRRLVLLGGEPVVTNYDIAAFLLAPSGIAFVVLGATLAIAALLAELAGQTWIAGHAIARAPLTLRAVVLLLVQRAPALLRLALRILARLVLLALPFLLGALLVWYALLRAHDINFYLAERPPEWRRALLLLIALGAAYGAVAIWQFGRWLFAVPLLLFERVSPGVALKESARRTHGRVLQILTPLVIWWVVVLAVGFIVARLAHPLEAAAMQWAGVDFPRLLTLTTAFALAGLVGAFLQNAVAIVGNQFLVTRMYVEQAADTWSPAQLGGEPQAGRRIRVPALVTTCALILFAVGGAWFVASRPVPEGEVAVTAHRGDSSRAPENTLAAFRAAMEAHATYAELDVQRTRDGQVIVLHDRDLMRLAGDPRRIADLTVADLAAVDVGAKRGAAFSGEHVPTLEAVIALVRGHMKLNVELKYNGPDPELAAAVIDVLRRQDFFDQVVITSLNAAALRQVREIEPRLQIGQIVTAAVGDVTRADVDFLSLNSARATVATIRRVHAADKGVHVWTVNHPDAMLLMIERGANNLITDDPGLAVRLIKKVQMLEPPERLALRLRVLFSSLPPELGDANTVEPL
jgi:glycerophosphoryl diester phosphodiesterase